MEKEVQFPHKLYFTCNGGKNSKIGPKSFRDDFYLQYSLGYSLTIWIWNTIHLSNPEQKEN